MHGYPTWVVADFPCYRRSQRRENNHDLAMKIGKKLIQVRDHRYVEKGHVKSLTTYFSVPKGEDVIHIVYNTSKSGLNCCLWVPSFYLPSVDALVQVTDFNSWMGGLDLGEMFLNFPLDVALRPHCEIDLKPFIDEADS